MPDIVNKEDEKLGQRLQFYREQAGITQKEIADASGLSKNYISAIERGVHKCNAKTFIIYGKECNLSLDLLANLDSGSVILRSLKYALGGINFHSKKDEFIDMEILAHLVMYNVVSQSIEQVNVVHKNTYAVDFKMACHLVRHYFNRNNKKPYEKIYDELLKYINPVRPGRADKRRMKPKSPVWFVYRVA